MSSPEIQIFAISNVYCRLMNFKKSGDVENGHCHTYDHGTLLSKGKVLVEMLEDDGIKVVSKKVFIAPTFIYINKNHMHRITALEDETVACCIHALRDIEENILSSDFFVEQIELADSPEQQSLGKETIGKVLYDRGVQYGGLAITTKLKNERLK